MLTGKSCSKISKYSGGGSVRISLLVCLYCFNASMYLLLIVFAEFAKVQLNIQQNKRTEAMEKLESLFDTNEIYLADLCRYQYAWLSFLQGDINQAKVQLDSILNETIWGELAHIFKAEIQDFSDKNISAAVDSYLEFLELYPHSIYYDDVRLRLREITS